jgi:hypothetical protein
MQLTFGHLTPQRIVGQMVAWEDSMSLLSRVNVRFMVVKSTLGISSQQRPRPGVVDGPKRPTAFRF